MDPATGAKTARRNVACDECKRRKVRCSAEQPRCANCWRDGKRCTWSSPVHRASALEKTVVRYESLLVSIKKAWAVYVPNVTLEQALDGLESTPSPSSSYHGSVAPVRTDETAPVADDPEHNNAEEFEFDESQEFGDSIDGMGFLTLEPSKSGYTGPQSGIAALKVLRSLPSGSPLEEGDEVVPTNSSPSLQQPSAYKVDSGAFVDDYFRLYHPTYPLLHEGSFRARLSGALAKPRDGSWPLLYNMVLAIGAFTGDQQGGDHDFDHFRAAKQAISLSVIEKGSLSYVQGIALMADYLQKRNKPNAGFALVGIAWSMALAIGLHREFGRFGTTPFAMELRRRTWWTIFTSVSAAQLTLGRPPASLIGINVRSPINVNDLSLVVDMEELPDAEQGVTVTSCLIAQIPLATIANEVQAALLTHQVPVLDVVDRLDRDIESWLASLPSYLHPQAQLEIRFELPKRVLLWRSYHLRIILNRPFLFQAITRKADITAPDMRIQRCVATADACVQSICQFLDEKTGWTRGFAWYAVYWLISASFVHAICFAYAPQSEHADGWKMQLQQAIQALQKLSFAHCMALKAKRLLQKFHDRFTAPMSAQASAVNALPQFMADNFGFSRQTGDPIQNDPMQWMGVEEGLQAPLAFGGDADVLWSWQPTPNAEFLDAAGGGVYQDYQDNFGML